MASKPSPLRALMTGPYVAYYGNLARALGRSPSAAIFLGCIARWEGYSEDGWVFRTQEQIEEETALTARMQGNARKILVDSGAMEEEKRGLPQRLFYRIDWGEVEALLQTYPEVSLDQPEGNSKPNESADSNIQARDTSKIDNDPPGAPPEPEPTPEVDEDDPGKITKELVAQLIDRIDGECSTARSESYTGRFARDCKRFLVKGGTAEEVDEAIDRIIERYDDYKLALKDALDDVRKGKGGTGPAPAKQGSGGAGESNVSPITPGSGVATPPAGIAAVEASNDLKRYAQYAYKHDFSANGGEERPPWPVFANLGGDDDEREANLRRIRSVVRRGINEAEQGDNLRPIMHYYQSFLHLSLEPTQVGEILYQAEQEGWGHQQVMAHIEETYGGQDG
jgi:hypothetical protein